jgi:hypothetical protein
MRGDIKNSVYAGRAKEYAWSLCTNLAPRKISPSDIDYYVECNGKFLFFEMKTKDAKMDYGQELALSRLLKATVGKSILLVVKHEALDLIEMPTSVISFDIWAAGRNNLLKKIIDMPYDSFVEVYQAFFDWADGDKNALKGVIEKWELSRDLGNL